MKIKRYLATGGEIDLPDTEQALIEHIEEYIDIPMLTEELVGTIIYQTEDGEYHKLYLEVHDDIIDADYAASYLGIGLDEVLAGDTHEDSR